MKQSEFRLMGIGHRLYKNYDPRATIIKQTAEQVFEVTGRNPPIDLALDLEKIARPRQVYLGKSERDLVPIDKR